MKPDFYSNTERFLRSIIEQKDIDVLFECFAGLLVSSEEIDAQNIHVIPNENHRRNYKNDIILSPHEDLLEPDCYFDENERDLLIMYTSRSAILDYFPEAFYTEPDNTDEYRDESGRKRSNDEIEKYRNHIKAALKSSSVFFRPLEVEYNKFRIHKEIEEVKQLENFDRILETFWANLPIKDAKWRRFVRTLHLVPYIIGNKEKTTALIAYVLDVQVELIFSVEEYCDIQEAQLKALTGDEKLLGFNLCVGNKLYDYLDICTLKISELSTAEFFGFFDEHSEGKKLLNEIIKYYFPLNVEVELDFSINPKKGRKEDEHPVVVLGYSSTLG